jgi:tRNA pseudouridine38-40 synthase
MTTFKITLAYDGTDFVGWQRQASGTSIQGLLEEALGELDERPVAVAGAGRTDAGVHALGQVASFSLERQMAPQTLVRALNAKLPTSVRVGSAIEAPAGFHARFGARAKFYRYRIWNGDVLSPFERRYVWHIGGALDLDRMIAAARFVVGKHDFAAFQAGGSSARTTEREVSASRVTITTEGAEDTERNNHRDTEGNNHRDTETQRKDNLALCLGASVVDPLSASVVDPLRVLRGGALLTYEIEGDGFLRHMVRIIVGTLVEVGRGRRPAEWLREVIESRDRAHAGPTAPAEGLFLVGVDYGPSTALGAGA